VAAVIIRVWKGEAKPGMASDYRRHLESTVFPQLRKLAGFRAAQLLFRDWRGKTEVIVITKWDSMDAIRQFAGSRPDLAVVEPRAREVLASFDETVAHYEIALEE
jgi:heme-degrading monooxygenase HmoA